MGIGSAFVDRWLWLCPVLMVLLAAGVLLLFGLSWWTALLAALLLVCPAVMAWGLVEIALDARRMRRRRRGGA